jgi:chaperonin cofactor prefoldin
MNEQTSGKKVVSRNIAVALGIICILLAVVSVGTVVSHYPLINTIQSKDSQISSLNSQIEVKDSQISSLNSQISSKDSTITNLNSKITTKNSEYSALQSEHSTLQDSHDSLQTNYNSLQSSYSSLQSNYNSLQSGYDSYISSYDNLRSKINNRTFGTDGMYFITPQDSTVKNLVIQITGGWSNSSDWNEAWTDIKMMYDWIVNNIEYRADGLFPVIPATPFSSLEYGQEMWQLPKETLDLKQGDCEDMAILLTSMMLCHNGGKYYVECISIKGSESAHMGVQIPVEEDKLTILDPAGKYYTQTSYGYIDMKDFSTEINNWLDYWEPEMGTDLYVYRVFSSYLDKSFSSTTEYTSWMYGR